MGSAADRELVIIREVKASRELVWEVWTDPRHIAHWWGPTGFTNTIHEMNVTPGGLWRFIMHSPEGIDFPNRIVFNEVTKPELLTFTQGSDTDNDTEQFEVTVNFKAKGNATEITMRMVFQTKEKRDQVVEKYGALEGNRQTMNRLEEYLKTI